MYNFSHQCYVIFLHNQRLRETASPCVLRGRMNQTDVSNTNSIFSSPSTPVNHEEDQPEQDFNKALKAS